jgi:hypothetical protein
VNHPGGNKEFLSCFGMTDLAIDLELQLTVKHKHKFIRVMNEILPALPRWIHPQVAAETPVFPVFGDIPPDCSSHKLWQYVFSYITVTHLSKKGHRDNGSGK